MNKTLKRIIVIAAIVILTPIFFIAGILAMLGFFSRPEVTTDITKYEQIRSGPNVKEEYQERLGLDESIWPNKITDNMEVKDYKMVYWNPFDNPFDPQYLGYLVVKYPDSEYGAEIKRLKEYKSSEYKGYYSVTGEEDYELLAVNADPYYGFIYALGDDDNTIIYTEEVFCGFMDLEYEKYMPKEYFLDGFDAGVDNLDAVERRKFTEEHDVDNTVN